MNNAVLELNSNIASLLLDVIVLDVFYVKLFVTTS